MKAVIYARFSSYSQQEQSIDGQLRACREYALRNGYDIVKEYCDRAKSGTNSNRPAFKQMLRDSETGSFDAVLVYQYDRFARNRRESINNEFLLEANGVKLISINEPIDENESTSIIVKGMFETLAEFFSKDLSRKVKRGLKESIIKRKSIGGIRWLGYKTDENMKIYIDDEEARVVRKIFEMRGAGQNVKDITAYLNNRGYKNKDVAFNNISVRKILSNEKYIGRYVNPYNHAEIITDMYPPIVDKSTFDAVQQTFKKYRYNSSRGTKNPANFYLSGKLFSAIDGTLFTGTSGYSSNGKKYCYYTATINDIKVKYSQKQLENEIINSVKRIVSTEKYAEYLSDKMVDSFNRRKKQFNPESTAKKINEIQRQIDKVVLKYIDASDLMQEELEKRLTDLRNQKEELEAEQGRYGQERLELLKNTTLVKRYINKLLSRDFNNEENRKDFFRTFVNSVYVSDNHVDFYLNLDVAKQITFEEYKNDVLRLEDVRLSSLLAE